MKKFLMILFAVLAVAFVAPAAFAQTGAGAAPEPTNWVAIAVGLFHGHCLGIMRHRSGPRDGLRPARAWRAIPGAAAAIRFALILGLVLIESMALYTFAIIFLKVK